MYVTISLLLIRRLYNNTSQQNEEAKELRALEEERTLEEVQASGENQSRHFRILWVGGCGMGSIPTVDMSRCPSNRLDTSIPTSNSPRYGQILCRLSPKLDRGCDSGFPVTTISLRGKSHGWKSKAKVSLFVVVHALFVYCR